jgi:hypothetical protein
MSQLTARPDAPPFEDLVQSLELEVHLLRTELSRLRVELRAAHAAVASQTLRKKDERLARPAEGLAFDLVGAVPTRRTPPPQ